MGKLSKKERKQQKQLNNALHKIRMDSIKNYADGAGSHRINALKGFNPTINTPDEDIGDTWYTVAARCLSMYMNSPLANGAIKTIRTNVVGSGLKLNAAIDFEFLKLTSDQANEWEKTVEREFRLWSDSPNCDAARRITFGQMQGLTVMSSAIMGDCFALLPMKKRAGTPYQTCVQLVDAARVYTPNGITETDLIKNGIEFDQTGEAIAAYINSNFEYSSSLSGNSYVRVPFFGQTTGQQNLIHIMQDIERIGQRRGVPLLAPVLVLLKQLTRYTESELTASLIASLFTVFLKTTSPQNELPGLSNVLPEDRATDYEEAIELGSGNAVALEPDQDITTASGTRDTGAFDAFVMALCRQIGASLEIPYEILIKNFTASYSASRGALLEFWKMINMRRQVLALTFCQPIYEAWLSEAVALGRINAPGFFDDPAIKAAWCGAEWYGPKQGQLNPLQEAKANETNVQNCFTTREKVAAELSGMAFEDIAPVRAREDKFMRENGLIKNDVSEVKDEPAMD